MSISTITNISSGQTIYPNVSGYYRFEVQNSVDIMNGMYRINWTFPSASSTLVVNTTTQNYIDIPKNTDPGNDLIVTFYLGTSSTVVSSSSVSFIPGQNPLNTVKAVFVSPSSTWLMPDTGTTDTYTFTIQSLPEVLNNVLRIKWILSTSDTPGLGIKFTRTTNNTPMLKVGLSKIGGLILDTLYYIHVQLLDLAGNIVSTDSQSFMFGSTIPDKPSILYPTPGLEIGTNPTFTSSPYSGHGTVHRRTKFTVIDPISEFEIFSKYSELDDGSTYPKPYEYYVVSGIDTLPSNKILQVMVSYLADSGIWVNSDFVEFKTVISQPTKPIITGELTNLNPINFRLDGSIFQGDTSNSFWSSEWIFSETPNPVTDPNKYTIPKSNFSGSYVSFLDVVSDAYFILGTRYYVQVRYIDHHGKKSLWSDIVTITMKPIILGKPNVIGMCTQSKIGSIKVNLQYSTLIYGNHLSTKVFFPTIRYTEAEANGAKLLNVLTSPSLTFTSSNILSFIIPNTSVTDYNDNIFVAFVNESGLSQFTSLKDKITWLPEIINTPSGIYPSLHQIDIPLGTFSFISSEFSTSHYLGTMACSVWQLSTDVNFNNTIWSGTGISSTSPILDITLSKSSSYYWRIRYASIDKISEWSSPIIFDTIKYFTPNTPSISTIDGTTSITEVSLTPTFASSAFSSGTGDIHYVSDWEVRDLNNNVYTYSYVDATNKVSWVSGTLPSFTNLKARVRYRNIVNYSEWSSYYTFKTISVKPETPSILFPVQYGTGISLSPTLIGSIYSGDSTHSETIWQISTDSGFSTIVFANTSALNLTSIVVGSTLLYFTKYYVRLKYKNSNNLWSDWGET